jgi:hypothetical protein
VLLIAGAIVMFDPDMMLGDDEWDRPAYTPRDAGTDFSARRPAEPSQPYRY